MCHVCGDTTPMLASGHSELKVEVFLELLAGYMGIGN